MDAEFWYRMVLLTLSSFLVGMTLVISVRHYFVWQRRSSDDWRGLLPLHVAAIALSYDLLLIYATIETLLRIEDDADVVWWRGAILVPAYITGYVAMFIIGRLRSKNKLIDNV